MKPDDLERDLGADLSRALDAAGGPSELPADLAQRLKAGLRREQALDRLLDTVPDPEVPAGLADRTLTALRLARRSPRKLALVAALATAAAVFVGFGLSWFDRAASPAALPEPELLAVLDVLESWEDLTDPDVVLGSWNATDGLLLDWSQTNQELNLSEETEEN